MIKKRLTQTIKSYKQQLESLENEWPDDIMGIRWLKGLITGLELSLGYLKEKK